MAVLSVTSKTLADRLRSMGVTERKSLTAVVDKALAFDRYFWLGVIDADGCVFHNRTRPGVQLCGSHSLVGQFRDYLVSVFDWIPPVISDLGNYSSITASSGKAIAIMRHLWVGHKLGLPRKRVLARSLLAEYGHLVPKGPKTSEYIGVFLPSAMKGTAQRKPWIARYGGRHIGYFESSRSAALAVNAGVVKCGLAKKTNDFRLAFGAVRHVSILMKFQPPPLEVEIRKEIAA